VVNGEAIENRESMAEATIMLLLSLLYRLHDTEMAARESKPASSIERHMLKGRKIGIIGYGGITRAVIRRLSAWHCEFLVCTRSASKEKVEHVRFVPLAELLKESDAILVLTSLDAGSRRMLGAEQLSRVKRGAILVNTARGGIVDEAALVDELRSGRVAAAALDVFEEEPLRPDHPLRSFPNVILTPHAIGHTEESKEAVPRAAVANVLSLLAGDIPLSCRNPSVAGHTRT
jgi:phosphoglycerate dehydrogenase-like enzyme